MSHTSHPYSIRLGILRTWKSRWFSAQPKEYRRLLREDLELRNFLEKRLRGMFVDSIEIERSPAVISVIIKTARPGLLIGRGGEGVEKLKREIATFLESVRRAILHTRVAHPVPHKGRSADLRLLVEEVSSPESHAKVMIEQIAQDLEKRMPFRRVMKQTISKMMSSRGVEGAKVALAGRLDGSEMARHEWLKEGKIPLQTLRADVDFARGRAHLPYGDIGIKVWIYRGEIFEREESKNKGKTLKTRP